MSTPSRNESDGTARSTGDSLFSRSPSKLPKMNILFRLIGPPAVPPKVLRVMSSGGVGVPAKLNESALRALLVCCSKADPL